MSARRAESRGAAIVTTLRAPGACIRSFVRWHLSIGFDRIYLFFDDPTDPDAGLVEATPGVKVVRVDAKQKARMRRHPVCGSLLPLAGDARRPVSTPEECMARQACNTMMALDLARREGIRWLLHIDCDELFFPGGGSASEHFKELDELGIGHAVYRNHEAVSERPAHEDPFREMTLFKRNPYVLEADLHEATRALFGRRGDYFLAYVNGKSAVRAIPGVTPAGPHRFLLPQGELGTCLLSRPAVLHYPYWSFDQYWNKHARQGGDFKGDEIFGKPWMPPTFKLKARDFIRNDDREGARRHYLRVAVLRDRRRLDDLLERGALVRIDAPARLLSGASGP